MRGASSIFHRARAESRVPLQMETNLYTRRLEKKREKRGVVVALVINRIDRLFYLLFFFFFGSGSDNIFHA